MVLLDSNIILYSIRPDYQHLRDFLQTRHLAVSVISKVEILGYHKINQQETKSLGYLFDLFVQIPVEERVVQKAIQLRQQRKMTLGDALIAATAIVHSLTLITANEKDFRWIQPLDIHNPVEST